MRMRVWIGIFSLLLWQATISFNERLVRTCEPIGVRRVTHPAAPRNTILASTLMLPAALCLPHTPSEHPF